MRLRLLVCASVAATLGAACAATGEIAQVSQGEVRSLADGPVVQTFVAPNDRLSRVQVWTATYGVEAPDSVVRLDLRGAGETRTALVAGDALTDNGTATFVFPPVTDSAGRRFTARFSADGEPVGLYVSPHDPYPEGRLLTGEGDLAFVTGHAGRLAGAFETVSRVPGEIVDRYASDPAFAIVWSLTLVGLAAAVTSSWWRHRSGPSSPPSSASASASGRSRRARSRGAPRT